MFTYDYISISSGNVNCNVGDVAYWDGDSVKTIDINNWSSSLGTPIGVVVIPSNLDGNNKVRIVSLYAVSTSGTATSSYQKMAWGGYGTDTALSNYKQVLCLDSNQVLSGLKDDGYLPSDNFTAEQSIVDKDAYYYSNSYTKKIPSPYSDNKLNPVYKTSASGINDFNGLSNTELLVGLGIGYTSANAAYNYNDGASNLQWYLPASGELLFLVVRFKSINDSIKKLAGVVIPSGLLCSSTETTKNGFWAINSTNGYMQSTRKDGSYSYTIAFACI